MNISQNSEFSATASPLNYKFGGKELQESGMYDFGARVYMPDVARWFNIDPLAELSPDLTPFRYGFNNPISFTDPTGMYESGESEGICDCYLEYPHETTLSDMAGFQTDLESEFREEMSEGMEGPDRRKQRDIEDGNENRYLEQELAREKQDNDIRRGVEFNLDTGCPNCPNNAKIGDIYRSWEAEKVISYQYTKDGWTFRSESPILAGTVPIGLGSPGNIFNILKSFKSALSFSKGGLTNVGRAIQKHPNILGLIGKDASSVTTNAARNKFGAEALKYIIRNGVKETKLHGSFGKIIEYKLPSGLGARFNATTNEFIGFLGRGL